MSTQEANFHPAKLLLNSVPLNNANTPIMNRCKHTNYEQMQTHQLWTDANTNYEQMQTHQLW